MEGVQQTGGWREHVTRWSRLLTRLSGQRTRTVMRASQITITAVRWRQRANAIRTEWRAFAVRIQTPLRMAYYVLPTVLTGRRVRRAGAVVLPAAAQARIIVNPTSGNVHGDFGLDELAETAEWLTENGIPTEMCETQFAGHAEILAREAAQAGMPLVIAAGGDGTVNSVVQGLVGTNTALGVLPMGTVNVWAREVGIPLNALLARDVLLDGVRRRVDVGRAGMRYFLLMAGIGFDAEIARRVEKSALKRRGLKVIDYLATTAQLSFTHRPTKVWMRTDGKRRSINALMILIGNTRLYGGAFTFAKQAVADDGWLDLVIIAHRGLLYRAGVFIRALLSRTTLGPHVRYLRCRTVRFEANVPLPVHVDGEVIGTLPMTFSVAPRALTVLVPRDTHAPVFSHLPLTDEVTR